jgi:hypothetical protein
MASRGQCNRCNQELVARTGYCCKYIKCEDTCDWYGQPDHCALARDPEEAKKFNPLAPTLQRKWRVENLKKALASDDEKRKALTELARINDELNKQLENPQSAGIAQLDKELHRLLEKYTHAAHAEIQFMNIKGKRSFNIEAKNLETGTVFEILMNFAKEQGSD